MLDLDSARWSELRHAYGSASDTPGLLRTLSEAPVGGDYRQEPWFTLWSSLCHQDSVYTASYASVPHIVDASKAREASCRLEYLHLAGYIECCRHMPDAPELPMEFVSDYTAALAQGADLTLESLSGTWDEASYRGLLGVLAAFRGFPELGAAILELSREVECPSCESFLVPPGYDSFSRPSRT